MKVKKLWISKYKNVEDIRLSFNTELTSLLVGKNGLGKSNLIEALTIIFSNLDLIENVDEIKLFSSRYFDFDVEYTCYDNLMRIRINDGHLSIGLKNKCMKDADPFERIEFNDFKKNRNNKYLPKYIIGYYSGENKRLKDINSQHENIQKNALRNWHRGKEKEQVDDLRKLFFTENHHGQLLLLTLAIYRYHEDFSVHIGKLFNEYLEIDHLIDFEIVFNNPDWKYNNIDGIDKSAEYLLANIGAKKPVHYPFWNLKGKIDLLLTTFYNYQIDHGSEPLIYPSEGVSKKYIKEYIEFSRIELEPFSNIVFENFKHPIDFFNALESTEVVGIFNRIGVNVKKVNLDFAIGFEQLSEGEQQLITVLGLLLITGKDDCLFLLDEPDTHLNPNWQRNYIRLLEEFNLNDDNSHVFVATHSPLLVQAVEGKYDILLYHLNENGKIQIDNDPNIIKNWRIDQVLASKYFDLVSTRPLVLDDLMKKRLDMIRSGIISEEDKFLLNKYKNEIGYLPTGETIEELESMIYIKKMADTLKNDKN
ncbi:hypothetical protein AQ505_09060 [Pedobacter sp. PACM 27299]|uniref:AAA family ATPase n=1 Tax=Pedobacter sp. PACM 27299 TaxID=1727164 RepID=UPI0007060231|nr:AAA family ATPase [Pedobacter sp. PACM 27299]ALL05629.1 hypothetical protein AQ505_09060 [Pedobacter sp. PACM 27299]